MLSIFKYLVFIALLFTSISVKATILDFNELAHDGFYNAVNPIASQGFIVKNNPKYGSSVPQDGLGVWGRNTPWQADYGFAAIFTNENGSTTILEREDEREFDLGSIDFGDTNNTGLSSTIRLTFSSNSGSFIERITLDNFPGLQTFVFNYANLTSVRWTTDDSGTNQFDNIRLAINTVKIPEPVSASLLFIGLLGMSQVRRRKSTGTRQ